MPEAKIRSRISTLVSGSVSDEIDLKDRVLIGIYIPSGIASATLKIATSPARGGTFLNVQDGLAQFGTTGDITFTITASTYLQIPPAITAGLNNIKLILNNSETAKTFELATREI